MYLWHTFTSEVSTRARNERLNCFYGTEQNVTVKFRDTSFQKSTDLYVHSLEDTERGGGGRKGQLSGK